MTRGGAGAGWLGLSGPVVVLALIMPAIARAEQERALVARHPKGLSAIYPASLAVREVPDGFAFASTTALRRPIAFTLHLVEGSPPAGPWTGTRRLDRNSSIHYRIDQDPGDGGSVGSGGEERRLTAVRQLPGGRHLRLEQVMQAEAPVPPGFGAGFFVLRNATALRRVDHPERRQDFRTFDEIRHRIKLRAVPLHDLAAYISAYTKAR